MNKLLFKAGADWDFPTLEKTYEACEEIAREEMELDIYHNQIELVTSDMMLDAYAAVGLPINYHHWSFGKSYVESWKDYKKGRSGLAYELIINSNPCINYLMEDNDMMMQMTVMAHASFGHNTVFKNNYMFKLFTDAEGIVDYMQYAKNFILQCEEKYGKKEVENLLDSCHALRSHAVDKYKRKAKRKLSEEQRKLQEKMKHEEVLNNYNDLWQKTVISQDKKKEEAEDTFEPVENILYFVEKHSPKLKSWQREIVRIVRLVSQYFYPQSQCKVIHEGMATFTEYYIVNRLFEKGLIDDGTMQSFLSTHSAIINQRLYNSRWYSGFNPYALGFMMFKDIKRICDNPTAEDKAWFPKFAGSRWQDTIKHAAFDYKDDSFIQQWLSPKVIRDLKLFSIEFNHDAETFFVTEIHNDVGYDNLRNTFAETYNRINYVPDIQIVGYDAKGDRSLKLKYYAYKDRPLYEEYATKTLLHLKNLWGYDVHLIVDEEASEEEKKKEDSDFARKFMAP